MFIYVNWDDKKILSEAEKDERIAEIVNDFAHDTDTMYSFLHSPAADFQVLADIGVSGDDAAVEQFREAFKDYIEKDAEDYFFEDYEEVEIGD